MKWASVEGVSSLSLAECKCRVETHCWEMLKWGEVLSRTVLPALFREDLETRGPVG